MNALVSSVIRGQLGLPKVEARFGETGKGAFRIRVTVPKASVNENHLSRSGKNEIWAARKVFSM